MDEKRRIIRTEIKNYLLESQDSVRCLVDKHVAFINGNINFNSKIKVSREEVETEIILLAEEGFFEKDENEYFKYYVKKDNISKIIWGVSWKDVKQ